LKFGEKSTPRPLTIIILHLSIFIIQHHWIIPFPCTWCHYNTIYMTFYIVPIFTVFFFWFKLISTKQWLFWKAIIITTPFIPIFVRIHFIFFSYWLVSLIYFGFCGILWPKMCPPGFLVSNF
jgi:hypothetical protein